MRRPGLCSACLQWAWPIYLLHQVSASHHSDAYCKGSPSVSSNPVDFQISFAVTIWCLNRPGTHRQAGLKLQQEIRLQTILRALPPKPVVGIQSLYRNIFSKVELVHLSTTLNYLCRSLVTTYTSTIAFWPFTRPNCFAAIAQAKYRVSELLWEIIGIEEFTGLCRPPLPPQSQ